MNELYDNIQSGMYDNKLPFPKWPFPNKSTNTLRCMQNDSRMIEYKNKRAEYSNETTRLEARFRADLEQENSTADLKGKDALYNYAWQEGHSSGYNEVSMIYSDLVDLILPIIAANK